MTDDSGGGSGGASEEGGTHDGFDVVNRELFSWVSKSILVNWFHSLAEIILT